jgi:hypothetical protein
MLAAAALSTLPLREALVLSAQLADLEAVIRQANEKLATLRSRKPYDARSAAFHVERRERAQRAVNEIKRTGGSA